MMSFTEDIDAASKEAARVGLFRYIATEPPDLESLVNAVSTTRFRITMKTLLLFAMAMLTACTKTSNVFRAQGGVFQITGESIGLVAARDAARQSAIRFCERDQAEVLILQFEDHVGSILAASTLSFRCVIRDINIS
jgi:hypothetical protein